MTGSPHRNEYANEEHAEQYQARADAVPHRGEGERKRTLYGEIHAALEPGGAFLNLEHVASPTARIHARFLAAMAMTEADEDPSNRLAPVEDQLAWLRETGFEDVDCHWKWLELALLGGRQAPRRGEARGDCSTRYRPGSGPRHCITSLPGFLFATHSASMDGWDVKLILREASPPRLEQKRSSGTVNRSAACLIPSSAAL